VNICMVLANSDFPPDIRVEKEARSLICAGHRVFLLCLRKGESPLTSLWNGVEIKRISPLSFFLRKLNSLVYVLFVRDLQWKRAIRGLIKTQGIAAIHVHDLPMVGTALSAASGKGIPVIADLHENYPALMRLAFSRRKPNLAERLMPPGRWERLERRWLNRCAHVIVVVEEAKERLAGKGIPAQKIAVVENTVDAEHFLSRPGGIDEGVAGKAEGDFVICYVGGFSPHRGLDTAIRAMARIVREIARPKLLLVGDGEMRGELQSLSQTMGLNENVVFPGWVDFREIPGYISGSDVCIVPCISTEHTETTAPHKLYQYMLMGKPVVVSSCRPLRRVVEGSRCGLVFEAGDADSLADCILKLKDTATRKRMGEAGREAVFRRHNWEISARRLLGVYDGLARGNG